MIALGAISFVDGRGVPRGRRLAGARLLRRSTSLLVYIAFKLNYRSGRLYETVELTPAQLDLDARAPLGPAASSSTATPTGRA